MIRYIWQRLEWPQFHWDQKILSKPLAAVRHRQGRLLGRMESLGFPQRDEAMLKTLTLDVVKSSEIESEILNPEQVRSSIARRLGLDIGGLAPADRRVDGVVRMMLEATQNYAEPLSEERLFGWHKALFIAESKGGAKLKVGAWRDDSGGPMQVVSGAIGRERVHYEAPPADRLSTEMTRFIHGANGMDDLDPVLKAAVAHLWFVTLHPFDDGNGRIARAIADWTLARSENSPRRFYSMSAQIWAERREYYDILERTQKGPLDITHWMRWFLDCLDRALHGTEQALAAVFAKDAFWKAHAEVVIGGRQRLMVNKLLDGFEGKLTSSKWGKLTRCSQDTAQRDIVDLVGKGILVKDRAGGRSTSYSLT